jgi:hypothetical protein
MEGSGGSNGTKRGTISLSDFKKLKPVVGVRPARKGDSGRWSTPAPQSSSFYNSALSSSSSHSISISPSDSDSEDGIGAPAESTEQLRHKYERLLAKGRVEKKKGHQIDRNLYTLRRLVLVEGIPPDERDVEAGGASLDVGLGSVMTDCSLRAQVWKILLRVPKVDAAQYEALVKKGAFKGRDSEEYKQVRKDVGRTGFRKNPAFIKRVPDAKLSRVLNAFLHSCGTMMQPPLTPDPASLTCVVFVRGRGHWLCAGTEHSGQRVPLRDARDRCLLCAAPVHHTTLPSLLQEDTKSRTWATCILRLRTHGLTFDPPLLRFILQENHDAPKQGEENHSRSWAVDAALYLLDQSLQVVDPGLHHHLKQFTTHLYLYTQCTALSVSRLVLHQCFCLRADLSRPHSDTTDIYSFNAIVPLESGTSLDEVMKLWDFMFAFGAHLNILFTVARVIKARCVWHSRFARSLGCVRAQVSSSSRPLC